MSDEIHEAWVREHPERAVRIAANVDHDAVQRALEGEWGIRGTILEMLAPLTSDQRNGVFVAVAREMTTRISEEKDTVANSLEQAITGYLWKRILAANETLCRTWAKGIMELVPKHACKIEEFSSRACEWGTHGCVVHHG